MGGLYYPLRIQEEGAEEEREMFFGEGELFFVHLNQEVLAFLSKSRVRLRKV